MTRLSAPESSSGTAALSPLSRSPRGVLRSDGNVSRVLAVRQCRFQDRPCDPVLRHRSDRHPALRSRRDGRSPPLARSERHLGLEDVSLWPTECAESLSGSLAGQGAG